MSITSLVAAKATESMVVDHSKDGETQVPYIVAVLTVACVLSTTVVVLRLYTRLSILNTFGADDFVMAITQVLTLGSAAAIYIGESEAALLSLRQDTQVF